MALIQCPECGKDISSKVKSCPHCGYPMEEESPPINPQQKETGIVSQEAEFVPKETVENSV